MAEAALFGLVKSVLKQLGSPAFEEFRFLWGYKEHLEKFKDTVTTINNVLEDADRQQATNRTVQGWLDRLRVVLYEADDFFDAISAKGLLEKVKKDTEPGKKVPLFVWKLYHFPSFVKNAHEVKKLRERFDDIAADINKFNFVQNLTNDQDATSRIQREETHSFIQRNEVVGREQETEDLVRMLLSDSNSQKEIVFSVIGVIGMGGLGKTTLAKLVYNDERVQKGFDLHIWACINYFLDVKQFLITLLKGATIKSEKVIGATPEKLEDLNKEQLQFKFRKEIKDKRFLLILDDVWDEDHQNWRNLKPLLTVGEAGSMVLTTTRSEGVAKSLCAIKPYFHLKEMEDESAWLLFKKVAFEEEGDQNSLEFEDLGQQIVRKCANVPLAIITIASLLREKEKDKWFPLVIDELSSVSNQKKIMPVLKFSYKQLPYEVKRCFGYCSLFPKDFKFDKDSLIRLWIAQGFVEPVANQSLEDKAEEYLSYLVKRCFFQFATGDKETSSTTAYQMHDLAMEVAGSECILVNRTDDRPWDKTVHHVSILNFQSQSMVVDRVCSFPQSRSLRTFLNPGFEEVSVALNNLMLAFGSLRVLDLSSMGIEEVPTSIGGLIHLRFLNLSTNNMKKLPSSICSLPHLQSLILQSCSHLKELPKEIAGLISLRHLLLEGCGSLEMMPPGLAALTSLVTLDKLVVHNTSGGLQYLELLDNLSGSLKIYLPRKKWDSATTDLEKSSLSRKTRIHSLAFIRRSFDSENLENMDCELPPNLRDLVINHFGGEKILNGISSLYKLVILRLQGCKKCVKLPPLSHLPSLKKLCIANMISMLTIEESKVYELNSFFPSLETLRLENMKNLKSWWPQAPIVLPIFPRLTSVAIYQCPELTGCMPWFPTIVEDLSLRDVEEEIIWQIIGREVASGTSDDKAGEICIAEVRRTHLLRVRHLDITTINRNLFKGLKDLAFLETLKIVENFNAELQEEDEEEEEEGSRWKDLHKLHKVILSFGKGFSMRNNQRLLNGFQDLTSLNYLDLSYCKELYLSWRALLSLPHLHTVRIIQVEEVIDVDSDAMINHNHTQPISRSIRELMILYSSSGWVHDIPWMSLPCLEELTLWYLSNWKSLPEGIQHLSALKRLGIYDNPDSTLSFPHWICSLESLNNIYINGSSVELKS